MNLAITICATVKYTYALGMQANAVISAICELVRRTKGGDFKLNIVIVGNGCEKSRKVATYYKNMLVGKVDVLVTEVSVADNDDNKNYKAKAQLLISKLRTLAFNEAKRWGATHVWSLDSDVIPKANSLACMADTLKFDDGYYSVASCIYPSQGGGLFLCGRGTPKRNILEDIYLDEKEVPERVLSRIESYEKEVEGMSLSLKEKFDISLADKMRISMKKVSRLKRYIGKKCKPKTMNVFELNSKKWRKRGWFDFAYPAIGKGAVVPTDWMGFGCALINEKALNLIDFSGYMGGGTEDLFIIWNRWHPNGIKIAAIPHCPADHIVRIGKNKDLFHIFTYHEPDGEFVDHLRQDKGEFLEFEV